MFCSSCGKPIDETDLFCSYCGASTNMVPVSRAENNSDMSSKNTDPSDSGPVIDADHDSVKAVTGESETAGTPFESAAEETDKKSDNPLFSSDDFDEMRKRIAGKAKKAQETVASNASSAMEKVSSSLSTEKKKPVSSTQKTAPAPERAGLISNEYSGSNYMTRKELWTWLKKDSKRQQFYTEDIDAETEDEYIAELTEKLQENLVPVKVEKRKIEWDRRSWGDNLYFVTPTTKVVNPLSYIVQFSHVGKFTYVEEKTFITPPKLPPSPHIKKAVDRESLARARQAMMYGGGLVLVGLIFMLMHMGTEVGLTIMGSGAFLMVVGVITKNKANEVLKYNAQCDREMAEWNGAWNKWQNSIFIHSFQEDANGQLSRIYDSVHTTINQLNELKYKDRKTMEDRDKNEMAELESMIKIKQQEYR